MKLCFPYYYEDFSCIASACPDNCCVGWEICIDKDTMEKYRSIGGEFGKKLKKSIIGGSFVLKNGRCPFLNDANLCEIITHLGEDMLCDICKRHPRFAEQFGDTTEVGLGLSCPECARIILSSPIKENYIMSIYTENEADVFGYIENDDNPKEIEALLELRRRIFKEILSAKTAEDGAERLLDICLFAQNIADNKGISHISCGLSDYYFVPCDASADASICDYVNFMRKLEPVDENWKNLISSAEKDVSCGDFDELLRNVLLYYVYRYLMLSLFDGDIYSRGKLCVFSFIMIRHLLAVGYEGLPPYRIAAMYSKQMEYSEECLDAFYDDCNESELFDYDALVKLLRKR